MKERVREFKKFVIAASGGDAAAGVKVPLPVGMKKHIFQASTAITLTPVLFSGADSTTTQAIAAGETWETSAPLSGFKSDTAASIYWCGESI